MTQFVVDDLRAGYTAIGHALLRDGDLVRNKRTGSQLRELRDVSIVLTDPLDALPLGVGRKVNPSIGAAEAIQLVGGWSDPAMMSRIAPSFEQFLDAGAFHAAYGVRLREQLPKLVEHLRDDPTSRQAVVTIWEPLHDQMGGTNDTPCTVNLQWLVRDDMLHAYTHMRSNDFWWGLAYDAFQFTQLQVTIARFLGLQVGEYHHHVVSFHAYSRDWENIMQLHGPETLQLDVPWRHGLYAPITTSWRGVQRYTRQLLEYHPDAFDREYGADPSARWYRERLVP